MIKTSIKKIGWLAPILLVSIFITTNCYNANNTNKELLFNLAEIAKKQKDNPIDAIAFYEFLLKENESPPPNTFNKPSAKNYKKNATKVNNAVLRSIHYNLFVAYFQLFSNLTTGYNALSNEQIIANNKTIKNQYLQETSYFVKAITHLELAKKYPATKKINDQLLYKTANYVWSKYSRISNMSKDDIASIKIRKNASYYSMFSFFALILLLLIYIAIWVMKKNSNASKKIFFILLTIILLSYLTSTTAAIVENNKPKHIVALTKLPITELKRTADSTTKEVMKLLAGERLLLLKNSGSWFYVQINALDEFTGKPKKINGWVKEDSLEFL